MTQIIFTKRNSYSKLGERYLWGTLTASVKHLNKRSVKCWRYGERNRRKLLGRRSLKAGQNTRWSWIWLALNSHCGRRYYHSGINRLLLKNGSALVALKTAIVCDAISCLIQFKVFDAPHGVPWPAVCCSGAA